MMPRKKGPRPPRKDRTPEKWVAWFNENYPVGTSVGLYYCETDRTPKVQSPTGAKAKLAKNGKPIVYLKMLGWFRLENIVAPELD